jgi:hypothetical protein
VWRYRKEITLDTMVHEEEEGVSIRLRHLLAQKGGLPADTSGPGPPNPPPAVPAAPSQDVGASPLLPPSSTGGPPHAFCHLWEALLITTFFLFLISFSPL